MLGPISCTMRATQEVFKRRGRKLSLYAKALRHITNIAYRGKVLDGIERNGVRNQRRNNMVCGIQQKGCVQAYRPCHPAERAQQF
ncbi:MAG: hypothetical protein CK528_00955 [Alcaligenaceae bacterium]|nr:MAG: hypothetical protein CK528_00955 [Alcaligenaceae bacterium]